MKEISRYGDYEGNEATYLSMGIADGRNGEYGFTGAKLYSGNCHGIINDIEILPEGQKQVDGF